MVDCSGYSRVHYTPALHKMVMRSGIKIRKEVGGGYAGYNYIWDDLLSWSCGWLPGCGVAILLLGAGHQISFSRILRDLTHLIIPDAPVNLCENEHCFSSPNTSFFSMKKWIIAVKTYHESHTKEHKIALMTQSLWLQSSQTWTHVWLYKHASFYIFPYEEDVLEWLKGLNSS